MEAARPQEAGCLHLLWLLRGEGVARADRPLHGPPWHARRNGSALGSAGCRAVDDAQAVRAGRLSGLSVAPVRVLQVVLTGLSATAW